MSDRFDLEQVRDAETWDKFVKRYGGHLLQSYYWGELKTRFGWEAERWARVEHGEICAGAQVLLRRILPGLVVAYVPRGPVLADADFLRALRNRAADSSPFLFKLEPDWLEGDERTSLLRPAGWLPSDETIQPRASIRIDLTHSLDDILGSMKPKWRYNIRLAEKKGVTVREAARAELDRFYELMQVTASRDKFPIHPPAYYRAAFDLLVDHDHARLLTAEYQGQNIAMILVTFFGHEAIYLYGASANEQRNVMPNHALHWAAIKLAKERGCRQYDLWGVPENADSGDDRLPGSLYQFKQGFGGTVVSYTGAFDLIAGPLRYRLYRLARRIRRSGLS
jgi:lipid II:glycine glycyltransferase (peptidoglycan interpeptide bridge formation enzyme)